MRNLHDWLEAVIDSHKISKESAQRLEEIRFFSEYAEMGYNNPESGIIALGNWNEADRRNPDYEDDKRQSPWIKADDYVSRVAEVLENRYKVELEWDDEWDSCSECSKLVRTGADGHGWTASFVELEGDAICRDCIPNHVEEILEEFEGDSRKALSRDLGIDPTLHGWVKVLDGLEDGFHEHMAADPKVIAKELKALGVSRFLFTLDDTSQFFVTFSCWVHKDDLEKCEFTIGSIKTDADVSPATLMKRALQNAPVVSPKSGEFAYTSVEGGTSKTTVMTHEQIRNCPSLIMLPSHYNADGTCKCVNPDGKALEEKE